MYINGTDKVLSTSHKMIFVMKHSTKKIIIIHILDGHSYFRHLKRWINTILLGNIYT